MIKCLILLLKYKNQLKNNKNKEILNNFLIIKINKSSPKILFLNFQDLLKEIFLMMKNLSTLQKIQKNKLQKFHKRWKDYNILELNSILLEISINKFQKECPIFILLLLILQILNLLINGPFSFILIFIKELLKKLFLESKIVVKTSLINSSFFSMNHYVEVFLKRIKSSFLLKCLSRY